MDKKMNSVYRMEYYAAIKRKRRHTICRKSDGHGDIILKKYPSLKKTNILCFLSQGTDILDTHILMHGLKLERDYQSRRNRNRSERGCKK